MNPYPEYTLPDFVHAFKHACDTLSNTTHCDCAVCTAFSNECTKCVEIQVAIQELKDKIDEHLYAFREELMTKSTMNYMHIDAIQMINIRIKQLQSIIPK